MYGMGPEKLILILLIVLVLFGAKRIPEIAGSMGKGVREFKKSISDVQDAMREPAGGVPERLPVAGTTGLPATSPAVDAVRRADEEVRPEPKRLLG
ncbi:MAG: hypothetical protein NVS1B4_18450 [Gemmatimonadaceae bacterium]